MAIIVIITKASVSSLESSCFSTYSGAPQGHHVIFPRKGPPCPLPHIYHCYISYINISLLHPRWDEQCRDTMMTVPPQLTSSLPSFSYPASFRHPPPASSVHLSCWKSLWPQHMFNSPPGKAHRGAKRANRCMTRRSWSILDCNCAVKLYCLANLSSIMCGFIACLLLYNPVFKEARSVDAGNGARWLAISHNSFVLKCGWGHWA